MKKNERLPIGRAENYKIVAECNGYIYLIKGGIDLPLSDRYVLTTIMHLIDDSRIDKTEFKINGLKCLSDKFYLDFVPGFNEVFICKGRLKQIWANFIPTSKKWKLYADYPKTYNNLKL